MDREAVKGFDDRRAMSVSPIWNKTWDIVRAKLRRFKENGSLFYALCIKRDGRKFWPV